MIPSLTGVAYPDLDPHDIGDGEVVYRVGEVLHGTQAASVAQLATNAGFAVIGAPVERVDADGGTSWHVPVAVPRSDADGG